jgi:hypothetical protein
MQKADRSVVFNYSIDVQSVQCMEVCEVHGPSRPKRSTTVMQ